MSEEEDLEEEDELGPPVDLGALATLDHSSAFLDRLRLRIERRRVSADFASLFWSLPGTVLRGLLWAVEDREDREDREDKSRSKEGPDG